MRTVAILHGAADRPLAAQRDGALVPWYEQMARRTPPRRNGPVAEFVGEMADAFRVDIDLCVKRCRECTTIAATASRRQEVWETHAADSSCQAPRRVSSGAERAARLPASAEAA